MNTQELNERIEDLLQSPDNMQAFADLASPAKNWKKIDKNIPTPDYVGFKEEDCPVCYETVRLIFDKYATENMDMDLVCPHCKKTILARLEYTGYTSDIYLFRKK